MTASVQAEVNEAPVVISEITDVQTEQAILPGYGSLFALTIAVAGIFRGSVHRQRWGKHVT